MKTNESREGRGGGGNRGDRGDDPPMSRLFIICNKAHSEEDFREAFEQFGEIEDIWVVKDKYTGDNKGVTYIKFSKTSEAARAQEEMNGKSIGSVERSLKVLVASDRNQGSGKSENEKEKYVRLFIVCPKTKTEDDLRDEFGQWGPVESVTVVKDKKTGNAKGFAYIRFPSFYSAAVAFESCPDGYKPVFAEPQGANKRQFDQRGGGGGNNNYDDGFDNWPRGGGGGGGSGGGGFGGSGNFGGRNNNFNSEISQFLSLQNVHKPQPTCLEVRVSTCINQDQLWRLFDIIPGLDYCQITRQCSITMNEALIVYDNPEAAIYARDKLHDLEYPMGERILIKLSGMSSSNFDASILDNRDSVCNVPLPPAQPMASQNSICAKRLFIVLQSSVPLSILKNVFSCWRGLMDVYLLPNKNCGYVKYADMSSANKAIKVLHGAEICGARIKVMEAEERSNNSNENDDFKEKRMRRN